MITYDYEHVTRDDGSEILTLVGSDGSVVTTTPDAHPYFDELHEAAAEGDDLRIAELADFGRPIRDDLTSLSDRVSVTSGTVYFDGDAMDNALSRHLIRMIEAGDDFLPVVRFMERLADNPSTVSRVALWSWLNANDFTINDDGRILGYKGVQSDLNSIHSGSEDVTVNGTIVRGHVPNHLGATISMDRDLIDEDRATSCSRGLHVGTWGYANTFGDGVTLTVLVDPADVVTVPSSANGQKMRVARYQVLSAVAEPVRSPVSNY